MDNIGNISFQALAGPFTARVSEATAGAGS